MVLRKSILSLFYFVIIFSYGQDFPPERFSSRFVLNNSYGELIYCGQNKHFTVEFVGKKFEEVEAEEGYRFKTNQNFIAVDRTIIQSTIVPIPNHSNENGSIAVEKILEGYLLYELNHIRKELKVNISDALMMPGNLASRKYVLWKYKLQDNVNSNDGETVKGQIHLSTICFNQILTLAIPITDFKNENKHRRKLVSLSRGISMCEKPCAK